MSIFVNICYWPSSLGEMIKLSTNKGYSRKKRGGGSLNNQQLKYHTQVKNRESLNFAFLFSLLCKDEHSLFFPWGLQLFFSTHHQLIPCHEYGMEHVCTSRPCIPLNINVLPKDAYITTCVVYRYNEGPSIYKSRSNGYFYTVESVGKFCVFLSEFGK